MNAPVYPKSLVGTTIYHLHVDEDGEETGLITAGTVLGISLDRDGDFFFLIEKGDGTLESWGAVLCATMEPRT